MKKPKIVETKSNITILFGTKPFVITKGNKTKTAKVRKFIKDLDWEGLKSFLNPLDSIKKYTKNTVKLKAGFLEFQGEIMPEVLVKRMIEMQKAKKSFRYLIKFWKNLKLNPSEASQKQLFKFLEANHFPFTDDGRFLAYKRVDVSSSNKRKLVDNYTKKINNSTGEVVSMPREEVNPDPNQTCSPGLHVAAWEYAHSYSGTILIEVLVNPKNVVAVPNDYRDQKMRVCEYKVMGRAKQQPKTSVLVKVKK
jgi:hypothetical protein